MTALLPVNQKPIYLLHIEDNHSDAIIFKDLISEKLLDLSINNAYDGDEAISFLKKNAASLPNIIILDLNLPRRTGTEVLYWIKQEDNLKHIPVIIFTTSTLENDVTYCYRNYVNTYLRKPKDLDGYIKVIDHICEFWLSLAVLPKINPEEGH